MLKFWSAVKLAQAYKIARGYKIARRHFCTSVLNLHFRLIKLGVFTDKKKEYGNFRKTIIF